MMSANGGNEYSTTNPTASSPTWTASASTTSYSSGISCPTTSFCVMSGNASNEYFTTDPASYSPTWTSGSGTSNYSSGVSCPTTSFCLMSTNGGNEYSTTTNMVPLIATTTNTYGDSHAGDVTQVTDPAGHVTNSTYDSYGDVATTTTNPSSGVTDETEYVYDADGEKICEASPSAVANGINCPSAGSARVAGTTTWNYNSDGDVLTETDPLGNVTTTAYDNDGNVIATIDPLGNVTRKVYDADSRVVSTTPGDPLPLSSSPVQQSSSASVSGATETVSLPSNVIAGDGLTLSFENVVDGVTITSVSGGGSSSSSGSSGAIWMRANQENNSSASADNEIWYLQDSVGGSGSSTISIHLSGSASETYAVNVTEWRGLLVPDKAPTGTTGTGTILSAPSLTPTYPNEIVLEQGGAKNANTGAEGGGFYALNLTGYSPYGSYNAVVGVVGTTSISSHQLTQSLQASAAWSGTSTSFVLVPAFGSSAPVQQSSAATTADTINLVGTSTATDGGGTTTLSLSLPSGIEADDELLVTVTSAESTTPSTPSGWTVVSDVTGNSWDPRLMVFSKTAVGTETTFTTNLGGYVNAMASAAVYRGVNPTTPIDQTSGTTNDASTITAPAITASVAGEKLVLAEGATGNSSAESWTPPTGYTQETDINSSPWWSSALADTTLSSSGSSGSPTAAFGMTADLAAALIGLEPATGSTETVTLPSNVTAGDGLTLSFENVYDSTTISSVSGGGGTWIKANQENNSSSSADNEIWYLQASTGGSGTSTIAITLSGTASETYPVNVTEWQGSLALDEASSGTTGTGTTLSAPSLSPNYSNEIVLEEGGARNANTGAEGGGFNALTLHGYAPYGSYNSVVGYVSTAGLSAQQLTQGWQASTAWSGTSASFTLDNTTRDGYDLVPGTSGWCSSSVSGATYCTTTINGNNQLTLNYFNANNDEMETVAPGSVTTTFTYDGVGNQLTKTTAAGTTTDAYDAANRLTSVTYSGTALGYTAPHSVTYSYDADGRRTQMVDGTGTTTYTYDGLGRLTSTTNGAGSTLSYGYDLDNEVTSITYPGGGVVDYGYDGAGEVTSIKDFQSRTTTIAYSTTSSSSGPKTTISFANGTTTTATDDGDNNEIALSATSPSLGLSYTRNADEEITGETVSVAGSTWYSLGQGYNSTEKVTSTSATGLSDDSGSFNYDPVGDPTQTVSPSSGAAVTQSFNGKQQLTSTTSGSTSVTYAYDSIGDRTSMSVSGGSSATYAYSQVGQLLSETPSGGSAVTYGYNGDGLRMSKTSGGTTESYTYDTLSSNPVLLVDGSTDFIYGPGGVVIEQEISSTPLYYVADVEGSTQWLLNQSGSVVGSYAYSTYGATLDHTGTSSSPIGFASGYTDAETGFLYLINRFYDPTTGQFLSVDLDVSMSDTAYQYAGDDPANATDASGLGGIRRTIAMVEQYVNTTIPGITVTASATGTITGPNLNLPGSPNVSITSDGSAVLNWGGATATISSGNINWEIKAAFQNFVDKNLKSTPYGYLTEPWNAQSFSFSHTFTAPLILDGHATKDTVSLTITLTVSTDVHTPPPLGLPALSPSEALALTAAAAVGGAAWWLVVLGLPEGA